MIHMEPLQVTTRDLHNIASRRRSLRDSQHGKRCTCTCSISKVTLPQEIGVDFSAPRRRTEDTFVPPTPPFANSSRPALDTNTKPNPPAKQQQQQQRQRPSLVKMFPGKESSTHSSYSGNHTMSSTATTTVSTSYNYNRRPLDAVRLEPPNNKVLGDLTMTTCGSIMDHPQHRPPPHVTWSSTPAPTAQPSTQGQHPRGARKWRLFRRNSLPKLQ